MYVSSSSFARWLQTNPSRATPCRKNIVEENSSFFVVENCCFLALLSCAAVAVFSTSPRRWARPCVPRVITITVRCLSFVFRHLCLCNRCIVVRRGSCGWWELYYTAFLQRRRNRGGNGGAWPRNAETARGECIFSPPAIIRQVYQQASAPLVDGIVSHVLLQSGPDLNQSLSQLVHFLHLFSGRRDLVSLHKSFL